MKAKDGPTILCDFHVHSIRSGHAFCTIDELAWAAKSAGLRTIAITDHGPRMEGAPHSGYFEMARRVPEELNGVSVLMGIEANIISLRGELDLETSILKEQRIVIAGIHDRTGVEFNGIEDNTRAMRNCMESGLVRAISHPFRFEIPVDVEEVATIAAATGVWLEVNVSLLKWALADVSDVRRAQTINATRRMIEVLERQGGMCVVSSDAHHSAELVSFPNDSQFIIKALDIPLSLVANASPDTV